MSLVNDMLRDLDKRKPMPVPMRRVGVISYPEGRRVNTMVVLGLVGLCVLAGFGSGYMFFNWGSVDSVPVAPSLEVAVTAPAPLQPKEAPVEASSVQLEVKQETVAPDVDNAMSATYPDQGNNELANQDASNDPLPTRSVTEPRSQVDAPVVQESYQPEHNLANSKLPATEVVRNDFSSAPVVKQSSPKASMSGKSETPVRVNRELSKEQQDRNTSQKALVLVQQGHLYEAYEMLLTYLSANPSAHVSRETLATVLFAQNELPQARIVVEEGLQLTPNYAPLKKIMARLLIRDGEIEQATQLMRNLPPELSSDPEYYELLATLYQQSNLHAQAVATYQELLRTNAQEGRWWAGLAISLEAQGKLVDANDSFQQALQTANLDADLRQYSQKRVQSLSSQQ